ncbi:MAG: MarR family transcriptional regulator [Candidatus Thermoplasmatota archaeon]|nr:MarR family transcriptional regulator [Candidatus Thermoplasmatota archaeon]
MADPLANQCTDARLDKVHHAFELLRLLDREIPGQLVSTFLYLASHDGCHKQALEQELNFTTASSSRNTDWLSDGRMGVKHKGLGLITKERDGRRQRLRLTSKGKTLARQMKSIIYG